MNVNMVPRNEGCAPGQGQDQGRRGEDVDLHTNHDLEVTVDVGIWRMRMSLTGIAETGGPWNWIIREWLNNAQNR